MIKKILNKTILNLKVWRYISTYAIESYMLYTAVIITKYFCLHNPVISSFEVEANELITYVMSDIWVWVLIIISLASMLILQAFFWGFNSKPSFTVHDESEIERALKLSKKN